MVKLKAWPDCLCVQNLGSVSCSHCVQSAPEGFVSTNGCHLLTTCCVLSIKPGHFCPFFPVFMGSPPQGLLLTTFFLLPVPLGQGLPKPWTSGW